MPDKENGGSIPWRLKHLEEETEKLWTHKASSELVEILIKQMDKLDEDFKSLRRILATAALSWVVGSGLFLIAVLELTK